MDKEKRIELIGMYKRCSDDDLEQMILEGRESFEDGAYELILAEAQKRGLTNATDDEEFYDEAAYETCEEINFDEVSTENLMGILVNIHDLDELNFHLASAEAIRRNIDMSDIRAYKKIVQCEQCNDGLEIEMIENPRPLIILKTIDEAGLYADTLYEEGIPFEIQIIVDDRDYKKSVLATNKILLPQEDE
jgi:hypothetical protein